MTKPNSSSTKILFIHGFGSCGSGNKAEVLRRHFGSNNLLAPDLPVNPADCIKILQQLIKQHRPKAIISSSLGCFYTTWLNRQEQIPAVLINPAVHPAVTLEPYIGKHKHWCTGDTFELTGDHIRQLRNLKRNQLDAGEKYLVLLQAGDEVLDYRDAVHFYQGQQLIVEPGGNHRFENLHEYLTMIDLFLDPGSGQAISQVTTA